jgi:hypothetical protein
MTNIYRPTVPHDMTLDEMIPMLRGGVAATSVYLKSVARVYRDAIADGDRVPIGDVPMMARIEHNALDCADYLVHVWDATSPVTGHPFANGEPIVFMELRKAMNARMESFSQGMPQTVHTLTDAFIGQIADTMTILAFATGLIEVGINQLSEYPAWHLSGAPMAITYLHDVITEHGWDVEIPANMNWTMDFNHPPGSALNAIFPPTVAGCPN